MQIPIVFSEFDVPRWRAQSRLIYLSKFELSNHNDTTRHRFFQVWLMVCLLVERYLYLRLGYFSRSVTSLRRHVRIISVLLVLTFCYIVPRFFEFKSVKSSQIPNGYRAVLTKVGNSTVYR